MEEAVAAIANHFPHIKVGMDKTISPVSKNGTNGKLFPLIKQMELAKSFQQVGTLYANLKVGWQTHSSKFAPSKPRFLFLSI